MMLRARYILALILVVFGLVFAGGFSISKSAYAFNLFGQTCKSDSAQNSDVCKSNSDNQSADPNSNVILKDIRTAANIVGALAGVIAVIMIVVSGLSLVTSGGNQEKVGNARRRILNAALGLAVVALAWTIIRFVTDRIL